jgi:hypothetical protein
MGGKAAQVTGRAREVAGIVPREMDLKSEGRRRADGIPER